MGGAIRILYPGILFLWLWHLGHLSRGDSPVPNTFTQAELISLGATATMLGITIHCVIRFIWFEILLRFLRWMLGHMGLVKSAEMELGGHARFIVWRFSQDRKDDPMNSHMSRQWSWVHAMLSTSFLILVARCWTGYKTFLGQYHHWDLVFSGVLFVGALLQCIFLWNTESAWVKRKP